MLLRPAVKLLLVLVLALPVVALVLAWTGGLLKAMGDAPGATAVGYVVMACQVAWAVGLVGLLVTLSLLVVSDDRMATKQITDEEIEE